MCVRLQVTHPFVTLPTPLSFSFPRSLRPWSNQCRWWIIHSELCRRKLFDWQLYSRVSYIINLALLGIAAMVKAIIGQGKAIALMEWILPLQSHSLSLFLCPFSPPPCFHVSSLSLFTLVRPPEGHRSLISHRAKYNVTQVAFWSVFGRRGRSTIENRSAKNECCKHKWWSVSGEIRGEKDDISFIFTQIIIQQNSQSVGFPNLYGCFFMMWIKSLLQQHSAQAPSHSSIKLKNLDVFNWQTISGLWLSQWNI